MIRRGIYPFLKYIQICSCILIVSLCSSADAEQLLRSNGASAAASSAAEFTPICSGGVVGDGLESVCEPPSSVHIQCPDGVTVACDGGNVLTPDCVLHLPIDACSLPGVNPGEVLPVDDLRILLRTLRSLYDEITTYAQALVVCVTAHETMHGIHASRSSGGPLLACSSETGAYDEEMRCWSEALENCESQSDCDAMQRHLDFATRARNYNQCLCSVHPDPWLDSLIFGTDSGSDPTWPELCASCQEATDYDDPGGNYCNANDPANPWIIG